MPRRVTIRVRVEGCLDAVIAKSLVKRQLDALGYRDVEVELPMPRGGKQGVLRDVIRYAASGIRSIAFVDADDDAREALETVSERARERSIDIELDTRPVPHVLLKRGEIPVALLAVWGAPPYYTRGSIEDLVCSILGGVCTAVSSCLHSSTARLCIPSDKHVYKVAVAALLAACSRGTLVYNPGLERCGFDIKHAINKLRISDSAALQPYNALLGKALRDLLPS